MPSYLGVFTLAVIAVTITFSLAQVAWITGSIRASRAIHERLTRSMLRTTFRFLDRTPVGRILQRFTQDIHSIDGPLSERTQNTFQLTAQLIQRMVVIVIFVPAFLVPGLLLAAAGIAMAHLYIKAQLPVKRCANWVHFIELCNANISAM
jgi:ABC-type multidrug transport system fused ATPase/permease subunit